MDRDQIHTDRDKLMDSYLRNELSDQDLAIFEEHLLYCKECRDSLSQRNRIIESIQDIAARDVLQISREKKIRSRRYLPILGYAAAAAGVALVIGLFLFPGKDQGSPSSQSMLEESLSDTMKDSQSFGNEMAVRPDTGDEDLQEDQIRKTSYLAEFQINPVYENLIGVQYRSGNLRVESPPDSLDCKKGTSIEIRYHGAESDSLFLVVLNRRGEIFIETKISSPHQLNMQFPEGLYYWQLTDEEESLHTAKISVRLDR